MRKKFHLTSCSVTYSFEGIVFYTYLTWSTLHRRSQNSIKSQPIKVFEPLSRPLILRRWPYPLAWITPCNKWVESSNWMRASSSKSRAAISWSQEPHLQVKLTLILDLILQSVFQKAQHNWWIQSMSWSYEVC